MSVVVVSGEQYFAPLIGKSRPFRRGDAPVVHPHVPEAPDGIRIRRLVSAPRRPRPCFASCVAAIA